MAIRRNGIKPFIAQIVFMKHDQNNLIRARSVCALGRIGRGKIGLIMPYFDEIMNATNDPDSEVGMNLIWASSYCLYEINAPISRFIG